MNEQKKARTLADDLVEGGCKDNFYVPKLYHESEQTFCQIGQIRSSHFKSTEGGIVAVVNHYDPLGNVYQQSEKPLWIILNYERVPKDLVDRMIERRNSSR